jgi:hypothetical protein
MKKETKKVATTTNFTVNQKFNFLDSLTTMVVNNTTPSILVVGSGGLGKTHSVTSTIQDNNLEEKDYIFIKGYSTARGLYNTLYDNNGKLIIFDDCDSVLEDRVAVNILKSALDSYETRTITWSARMNKADVYPQAFNFTGRIIFISNKDKAKIDGAILSRSLTVDLSMTPDEKIQRMEYILPNILPEYKLDVKKDALKFLSDNKESDNLNLRTLIMVSKIRNSYEETWEDLATYMINS